MGGFAVVIAVRGEHLNTRVVAVRDVEQTLRIEHQRMRQVELPRRLALATPGLDEIAVFIELDDDRVALAVALEDEDVAGRPDHRLVRFMKQPQMPERMPLAGVALDAE